MFKAIILLKRRADMSFDQFSQWWLGEHAKLALDLPGLRGLSFNLVAGNGDAEFDGVSELWFDSQAAFCGRLCDRPWPPRGRRFHGPSRPA